MIILLLYSFLGKLIYFWFIVGSAAFGKPLPHLGYLSSAIIIAILGVLTCRFIFSRRWAKITAAFVANLATAVIVEATLMYFRFFEMPLTIDLVLFGTNLIDIRESIIALARPMDLVLIVPDVAIIGLGLSKNLADRLSKTDRFFLEKPLSLYLVLLACLAAIWWWHLSDLKTWTGSDIDIMMNYNPVIHFALQGVRAIKQTLMPPRLDADKQVQIIEGLRTWNEARQKANRYIPWQKGRPPFTPNLLVIQFESLMSEALNEEIDGKPIAPVLRGLASAGLVLEGFHSQVLATADSDFCTLTSLFPLIDQVPHLSRSHLNYRALPKLMTDNKIFTFYMNPAKSTFWNTEQMTKAFGFEYYRFGETLASGPRIGPWCSDAFLFSELRREIKSLAEPFFAMVLTVSSHHPFNFKELPKTFQENKDSEADNELRRYANAIHYTDAALGEFLAGLANDGKLDRTIILIYGDHPILLQKHRERLLPKFEKIPNQKTEHFLRLEISNLPCILYAPNLLKPGRIAKLCSQVDIAPTLCDLVGIDPLPTMLGESVFIDKPGWVGHKLRIGRTDKLWLGNWDPDLWRYKQAFRINDLTQVEVPSEIASAAERIGWSETMLRFGWLPKPEEICHNGFNSLH